MTSQTEKKTLKTSPLEDIDQFSEALLVNSEISADVLWPHHHPSPGCRLLYRNSSVFIQVKKDCSGSPMTGILSIICEDKSSEAWCQWEPSFECREAGSDYEFRTLATEIHSAKIVPASIGYPQLILNLRAGCSPPPFFFQSGSVAEFRRRLAQCISLRRGETEHTWVNEFSSGQCEPAAHGPEKDECGALKRSADSTDNGDSDNKPPASSDETVSSGPGVYNAPLSMLVTAKDDTPWKWRALQGGASVVRNLRKGWAQACTATLDAAAAAAELLEKGGPVHAGDKVDRHSEDGSVPFSEDAGVALRERSGSGHWGGAEAEHGRCGSPPSPLFMPRPSRGDSIVSVGSEFDDLVLVENEHEPWQTRVPVSLAEWHGWFDSEGRLQFPKGGLTWESGQAQSLDCLRRAAYYGGISPQVRKLAWPYLLGCFPPSCTAQSMACESNHERFRLRRQERVAMRAAKAVEYQGYRRQWLSVTPEQAQRFGKFRERKHRIDKDVVRTDRAQPVFAAEHGEGLRMLHDVLLSYAFYNFDLSYCQGMSDLASPLVAVLHDEVEAFWCFQRLMEQVGPNFHKDQKGMHAQLQALHRICKVLDPALLQFLEEKECSHFYFCFRWLLILFKRELPFAEVLRLWEALWARVRGPDLHLFLAMALLRRHAPTIIHQRLGFDELLKYINDLALTFGVSDLLMEADALYQRYNAILAANTPLGVASVGSAGSLVATPSTPSPRHGGGGGGLTASNATVAVPVA